MSFFNIFPKKELPKYEVIVFDFSNNLNFSEGTLIDLYDFIIMNNINPIICKILNLKNSSNKDIKLKIDFEKFKKLQYLHCSKINLTDIQFISHSPSTLNLTGLYLNDNKLTKLDLSIFDDLIFLECNNNDTLTEIILPSNFPRKSVVNVKYEITENSKLDKLTFIKEYDERFIKNLLIYIDSDKISKFKETFNKIREMIINNELYINGKKYEPDNDYIYKPTTPTNDGGKYKTKKSRKSRKSRKSSKSRKTRKQRKSHNKSKSKSRKV